MLGAVEPERARIWLRASDMLPVQIEYARDSTFGDARRSAPLRVTDERDRTGVIILDDLEPDSRYYYRVLVDGSRDRYLEDLEPFRLATAPDPSRPGAFRVAFGSCARYQEAARQPVWDAVARSAPDLFIWLGDNIYADSLDPGVLRENYRQQRSVPEFQQVGRNVPQLAVWDDHDYGLNNHDRTSPIKEQALTAFRENWANPAYGREGTPGVFFRYSYAGVDFFFLDCRYHRAPNSEPDGPDKTMLGAVQLDWLKAKLANSTAPFKLLVSGSGWTTAKGAGGDSWASFLHERDALFEYIRHEKISGVVLLSGDTHVGEVNAIPWSEHGGYDLYDLVSSPLAQPPSQSWVLRKPEIRLRIPYNERNNFGQIDFELDGSVPRMRYQLVGDNGAKAWTALKLSADELVNGVQSWPDKVDPKLDKVPDQLLPKRQRG